MCEKSESQEIVDHLRVQWVKGDTGKVAYDSEKDKPMLGFPTKPMKFCGNCGGGIQPVVWMCTCCGMRFVQTQDFKTGRIMISSVSAEQEPEPTRKSENQTPVA